MKGSMFVLAWTVGVMALSGPAVATAAGQDSKSAAAAATLTKLLDERKLDAIAARDPEHPDEYIAALYIPGAQLLVVSVRYPVPAVIDQRIAEGKYRDAYMDLQGSGTREGRLFVTDSQADGLRATRERDAPFDIVYVNGVEQTLYNGDWKAQDLSEADYNARFQKQDTRYARLLSVLADALTRAATTAATVPPPGLS